MSERYSQEHQEKLYWAALRGELAEVESLVGGGWAHPNTEWKHPGLGGILALCAASDRGRTELALRLVALNADVNRAQSSAEYTPLHFAARNGKGETVEALLRAGARPDLRNNEGGEGATARELAVRKGHAEIAAVLQRAEEQQAHQPPPAQPIAPPKVERLMAMGFTRAACEAALTRRPPRSTPGRTLFPYTTL
eukprot:COSAG06_NODE_19773_length_823_cov_0.698895_1_plen_194_part_01